MALCLLVPILIFLAIGEECILLIRSLRGFFRGDFLLLLVDEISCILIIFVILLIVFFFLLFVVEIIKIVRSIVGNNILLLRLSLLSLVILESG